MATSMTGERIMGQLSFFKCYPLGFAELSLVCWPQLNPLRNYNICPSIWHKPLNTSRYSGEMCRRKNWSFLPGDGQILGHRYPWIPQSLRLLYRLFSLRTKWKRVLSFSCLCPSFGVIIEKTRDQSRKFDNFPLSWILIKKKLQSLRNFC